MSARDVLVQTRVSSAIGAWVERRAAADGDTVAGWVRRLLAREASRTRVRAWVRAADCQPLEVLEERGPCDYFLDLLVDLSPTTTLFAVVRGEAGHGGASRLPGEIIRDVSEFPGGTWPHDLGACRLVLGGSPQRHLVERVRFCEFARHLEIRVTVDPRVGA